MAGLTRASDHSVPRGRWLYILCGIMTIVGGLFMSAPILISPESAAGIKAGAKTGLSTIVCGLLFLFALFFSPVFGAIPHAGTSPVLIMIGVVLFQNVGRIDWRNVVDATPTFIVLFFIPFTFSIIQGVLLGYAVLGVVWLFTGDLVENAVKLLLQYLPASCEPWLSYESLTLFGLHLRKNPNAVDDHYGHGHGGGGGGGGGHGHGSADEGHESLSNRNSLSGIGTGQMVLSAEEERQLATIEEQRHSSSGAPSAAASAVQAQAQAQAHSAHAHALAQAPMLIPPPHQAQPQTPASASASKAPLPSGPTRRLPHSQSQPVSHVTTPSQHYQPSLPGSSSRDNILSFALGGPNDLPVRDIVPSPGGRAAASDGRTGRDAAYANFISSPLPVPNAQQQRGAGAGAGAGAGGGPGSASGKGAGALGVDGRGRSSSTLSPATAPREPESRQRVFSEGDTTSPFRHQQP